MPRSGHHQTAVIAWFAVMALSSALFAPIAIGVGRLSTHRAMRIAVPVGIAAAVVQVIGLARWPLLVPGFAADAASSRPRRRRRGPRLVRAGPPHPRHRRRRNLRLPVDRRLDLLVLVALGGCDRRRWFTVLGAVSAVLILAGVLTPLQLPGVGLRQLRRLRLVERLVGGLRDPHPASLPFPAVMRPSRSARRPPGR